MTFLQFLAWASHIDWIVWLPNITTHGTPPGYHVAYGGNWLDAWSFAKEWGGIVNGGPY